jgi:predicted small secreted protein
MVRRVLLILALAGLLLGVFGCNTVKGIGKDIESLGNAMSDAVDGN